MANDEPLSALGDMLEPSAVPMARDLQALLNRGGRVDGLSAISPAAYSAAVSLKRIADALDAGREQVGLYNLVTDLAWRAGQAFEQGKGAA